MEIASSVTMEMHWKAFLIITLSENLLKKFPKITKIFSPNLV
jgi:hypothetical protein